MNTGIEFELSALISKAAGDPETLGQLLEPYRGYLRLLARVQIGRRLQGKADASDLVQETFLQAHRGFARFEGRNETVLLAWLRCILATCTAKLVRRYSGTRARDIDLERTIAHELGSSSGVLERGLVDSGSSPSEAASRRERAAVIADALDQLPAEYREVVLLRQFEGLPFEDVALRMSRTVDSVQKLWVRGLDQLHRRLEGTLRLAADSGPTGEPE